MISNMKPDHLAKEAERLKNEQVLRMAIDALRDDALQTLARCDPDDRTAILRQQMRYAVANDIYTVLDGYILAGNEDDGGFAAPA